MTTSETVTGPEPTQRIIKIRRDYNTWVAIETIEDYALRYTPRSFRRWSVFRVSNYQAKSVPKTVSAQIGRAHV